MPPLYTTREQREMYQRQRLRAAARLEAFARQARDPEDPGHAHAVRVLAEYHAACQQYDVDPAKVVGERWRCLDIAIMRVARDADQEEA